MHTANPSIHHNTIANNANIGITIETIFASTVPNPTINFNAIVSNAAYGIFMWHNAVNFDYRNSIINARYNWWGTADPLVIPNFIYDTNDSLYLPRVDFSGYLVSPPGTYISVVENAVTNRFFDPGNNQSAIIRYTLEVDANVTVTIYDYNTQNLVRTLVNNQSRLAGLNTESFNGLNDQGQFLAPGVYIYRINVSNNQGISGAYDPVFTSGFGSTLYNIALSPAINFSAYKGDRLAISYTLSAPALVSFGFIGQSNFLVRQARDAISNIDHWDGRDSSGHMIDSVNPSEILTTTESLPENIIVIKEGTVIDISLLQSNPYLIRPLYNETTQISYTISASATVTVRILTREGAQVLRTLELGVSKNAGTYNVTWDGKTDAGETVAEEDDYRIRVEAFSAGGSRSVRDGNIRVLN
jgi:flagellar hook assembly protein FlgD